MALLLATWVSTRSGATARYRVVPFSLGIDCSTPPRVHCSRWKDWMDQDEYVNRFTFCVAEIACTHLVEDPPMPWEHKMLDAGECADNVRI